jgi:CBS domain-containing protein
MQVKQVMTSGVECISPNTTVQEAARKMKTLNVGPLPICDNDRLTGILTDRDITVRVAAEGRNPATTTVREAMTPEVIYCFEDDSVRDAAQLMEQKQIRRLLVLDRAKRLVGIVSLGDLAAKTHDKPLAGDVLERVSKPAAPVR